LAQETVVKEQLTPWAMLAGLELTKRLRETDFDLVCSLWLYSSDSNSWRLILASPRVETEGALHSYERIRKILASGGPEADLWASYAIEVVRTNIPLVSAIQSLGTFEIPDLPPGPAPRILVPKRVHMANIDGIFIEDSYIYFIR